MEIKINSNLLQVKDNFDIFIFDAYGVFYNGNTFFEGALDVMERLILEGKIVYILSNTTADAENNIKKYAEKGMLKGKHYIEFISSGEVLKDVFTNGKLNFKTKPNVKKVYVSGKKNDALFKNSTYIQVDNLKDADFIYLSAQRFSKDEYEKLKDKYGKYLFETKKSTEEKKEYSSTNIEPYMDKINEIIATGLPVLNGNPDYSANEGVKDGTNQFLITPGSITKILKEKGIEVVEYGKPYLTTYEYVFNVFKQNNIAFDKEKTCMVGDTLRTDIKGANNAGIKSVLCIETGITAKLINEGEILENLIAVEKVKVDYCIKSVSGY
ncbi:MAG: HAD hydrolase-like protein [Rickettsiales bacterium]|jgi:4-nitrophenyl phosphatase|nr:HAD hydrolase-like protein [Rickettsiales bacterium]